MAVFFLPPLANMHKKPAHGGLFIFIPDKDKPRFILVKDKWQ
jgi:hypothetical protein